MEPELQEFVIDKWNQELYDTNIRDKRFSVIIFRDYKYKGKYLDDLRSALLMSADTFIFEYLKDSNYIPFIPGGALQIYHVTREIENLGLCADLCWQYDKMLLILRFKMQNVTDESIALHRAYQVAHSANKHLQLINNSTYYSYYHCSRNCVGRPDYVPNYQKQGYWTKRAN